MRQMASKITKLNRQWTSFCKQNHYNKPHLFLDKDASFFQRGPLVQRPLKLKMARDAIDRYDPSTKAYTFMSPDL